MGGRAVLQMDRGLDRQTDASKTRLGDVAGADAGAHPDVNVTING